MFALTEAGRTGIQSFFFFNDTATTEIYTLSLHDALPISKRLLASHEELVENAHIPSTPFEFWTMHDGWPHPDRKSTRLNSSHANISYAVFCLKKKKHCRRSHLAASPTFSPTAAG